MKKVIILLIISSLHFGCKKKEEVLDTQPKVTTVSINNITSTDALCAYKVESNSFTHCSELTDRGVCWSKTTSPNIDVNSSSPQGCGLGGGGAIMAKLTPNTKYYVRAYASYTLNGNSGTAYGNELTFTTLP